MWRSRSARRLTSCRIVARLLADRADNAERILAEIRAEGR
jgi:hypothetical protein